ncbi:hypothetical protein SAMN04488028_10838 [Reichenbachiella agariperforans]|uniref:Uncharacterized protein n=1 Tax=Reichenbachiella agariperforans TaxID=156994 RepID=A0A1M6UXP9_REIAG|nr:hypothetical protein [Reichenbachiella agariperforans]SHK73988.1 hypothetical protein SAMN04488028_10838 [Reichenbachiella agariperforans]
MKKIINQYLFVLLAVGALLSSCLQEDYVLDEIMPVEDLQFSITQNPEDPNMVILTSETPNVTPLWTTPSGRSTRVQDTVKIAFAGVYKFVYGVQSGGGYVAADTVELELTTNNFDYIKDPLWVTLSGGVGNSKTWYLDLDAEGVSKGFLGPLYFYGTENGWLLENDGCYGADCWNWNPDYPGNSWLMTAADFGSMTFDLINGPNLTVDHKTLGRQEAGTYLLNTENKTMSTSDAFILHDSGRDGQVVNWGDITVFSLTEDKMQLGVLRDEALSGEGPAMLVYNFVTKDYYDNWVPEDQPDPEPTLPDGWADDVSAIVKTEMKWVLSAETPFNWAGLDGVMLNSWNSPSDYPDWAGFDGSQAAGYADFSLTMNSSDNSIVYVAPDGSESTGTYTLDEKGIYTFDGVAPSFDIVSGGVKFETTADNQLRIMSLVKEDDQLVAMWVGALNPDKPEYQTYLLELQLEEVDRATQIKDILTAQSWKIDSDRTYDVATSWGAEQGPIMFSDFATWAWNPLPSEHYSAGEASVDYGSMTFNTDGTVSVVQRKRVYTFEDPDDGTSVRGGLPEDGDVLSSDTEETLSGTWVLNADDNKLTLSIPMLHPWTCDYAVADWGATSIYRVQNGVLMLQVIRDAALSGESADTMTYVFVPE